MNEKKYTLPGMPNWIFEAAEYGPSTLWYKGAGFKMTLDTPAQEIIDGIKKILRQTTFTPDEAAFDVIAQASRNIDWREAIARPIPDLIAPLINEPPAPVTKNNISTELIDELCEHLKAVYFPLQKIRGN